jgi:hypothetical protein
MKQPERLLVYEQVFEDVWGVKKTFFYDKTKFKNGPIKVEIEYPAKWKDAATILEEEQAHLPITKRQYHHPIEGYLIGYSTYMKFVNEGTAPHPNDLD